MGEWEDRLIGHVRRYANSLKKDMGEVGTGGREGSRHVGRAHRCGPLRLTFT